MRKRILLSATCAMVMLAAIGQPAIAQPAAAPNTPTPEAMQAANDLFAILSKDMVSQMVAAAMVQAWPPIEFELTTKKADKSAIADMHKEYERIASENIGAVVKDLPAIYTRHFSVSEMRDLITFYQTPLGKKVVQEMPKVQTESQAVLASRLQDAQAETFVTFRKLMRQRGYMN
jgi:uncharacterized protein